MPEEDNGLSPAHCSHCKDHVYGSQNGFILLTVVGSVTGQATVTLCGPSCLLSFVTDTTIDMAAKGILT